VINPNRTLRCNRINKYAKCSPNCFIVALIYIDRLIEMRNIVLTSLNVHRILITSVLISTKVFDDEFYKNAYYAKLGGVSTSEMNSLELEFLSLVNFNLFVSTETFEKYQNELGSFVSVSSPSTAHSSLSLNASHEHLFASSSEQMSPIHSFDSSSFVDDGQRQSEDPLVSSSFFFADYTPVSVEGNGGGCMTNDPLHAVRSDGFEASGAALEYHAGDSFGGQIMGHHHVLPHHAPVQLQHHYPTFPPKQQAPGFGAVGHGVDQLASQWPPAVGLGYAHSHQSYPSMRMHRPPFDVNTQQPYYPPVSHHGYGHKGHHGGMMPSQGGTPGHVYYPPSSTTPTSVVDTFSYPSRLPSPNPYYDPAFAPTPSHSPHIMQHQQFPRQALLARANIQSDGQQFYHAQEQGQGYPQIPHMFPPSNGRSPPRSSSSHAHPFAVSVRGG
jgi:hypothetical protein